MKTLDPDLCCNEVIFLVAWEEFLFEFKEKLGESKGSEPSMIGINPWLYTWALNVVDDRTYTVHFCNSFVLKKLTAGIFKNVHGCNGDMTCE